MVSPWHRVSTQLHLLSQDTSALQLQVWAGAKHWISLLRNPWNEWGVLSRGSGGRGQFGNPTSGPRYFSLECLELPLPCEVSHWLLHPGQQCHDTREYAICSSNPHGNVTGIWVSKMTELVKSRSTQHLPLPQLEAPRSPLWMRVWFPRTPADEVSLSWVSWKCPVRRPDPWALHSHSLLDEKWAWRLPRQGTCPFT